MNFDTIIGIDPGANGGIALMSYHSGFVKTVKMPKETTELASLLQYHSTHDKVIVFLEKLSVRPDDIAMMDGKPNMGKLFRIQRMIAGYEHLKALLETLNITYIAVHPLTWQSKLGLRTKGESKSDRKHRFQMTAAKLYPSVKVTLWNADALLIMRFGELSLKNDVKWIEKNISK